LLVCAKNNITVTSEDSSAILVSGLFETLGLQTHKYWESKGQKSKPFVCFNRLVKQGIKARKFSEFNCEMIMSYKNVVARQLSKRISHHYTYPWTELFRDGCGQKLLQNNVRALIKIGLNANGK
jgi:hypothetical protein